MKRDDALSIGVTRHQIDRMLQSEFLLPQRNGTYLLAGATRDAKTAERAALTATTGLALGHVSAMAKAGVRLRQFAHDPRHVHVLIDAASGVGSTSWYTVHPVRRLDPATETFERDGVRATTVPRSIRDFAATLPYTDWSSGLLDAWVNEARSQNLLKVAQIAQAAELERSRKVRKRLMDLHARHIGTAPEIFKSIGEEWLRDLIDRRGLPQPLWNVVPPFATKEVDAYWINLLIVEFDGYWVHHPRGKFERDRAGDRRTLTRGGIPTVRVTKWDFEHDLPQLEDDIEFLLTRPSLRLDLGHAH